jgi:hypothetical protein
MQIKRRRSFANEWCRIKVSGVVNSDTNDLVGVPTTRYDLPTTYEDAHAKNNPCLAPHGFFRELHSGNNKQAQEFLEKFGPLTLEPAQRVHGIGPVHVNLAEFWSLQRRFSLIAAISESIDDRKPLEAALLKSYQNRYDFAIPIGQISGLPPRFEAGREYEFPWQGQMQDASEWLGSAPMEELRECALQLILFELNTHTQELRVVWERGWEASGRRFRPVVWVTSLRSAMWEFWGRDTIGLSWRRCPHCQTLFYPKRHDQTCCTPHQQALWSKRRYAAEQRAQERQRKRGNRRSL